MDSRILESQLEVQQMRNACLLEGVHGVRREVIGLEEREALWLQEASESAGVGAAAEELRTHNLRSHDVQRCLVDEMEQQRELRHRQADARLEQQLEKCGWHDKVALRARYDALKAKMRTEQDHNALLGKMLKQLTRGLAHLKVADCTKNAGTVPAYLEGRLRAKRLESERLEKVRARLTKMRENANAGGADDLSSLAGSDISGASDAASDATPVHRLLQENIGLTLEKQKLQDEIRFATQKKTKLTESISETQVRVEELRQRMAEHEAAKAEEAAAEEALRQAEEQNATLVDECDALQATVDQNNAQIHQIKDEIMQLQTQLKEREVVQTEVLGVQELERELAEKKQQLELNMKKIEERVTENSQLKMENKALSAEVELTHARNQESEEKLKAGRERSGEELASLKLKVRQLGKDLQVKSENIRNLAEGNDKLEASLAQCSSEAATLRDTLDTLRQEKSEIEAQIDKLGADIAEVEKNLEKNKAEESAVAERRAALAELLVVKRRQRDGGVERVRRLQQENEEARTLLKELERANEESKELEKDAASAGLFSWLTSRFSAQQDEAN